MERKPTTIRGFRQPQPSDFNESRVRLPDVAATLLFGGWGVRL